MDHSFKKAQEIIRANFVSGKLVKVKTNFFAYDPDSEKPVHINKNSMIMITDVVLHERNNDIFVEYKFAALSDLNGRSRLRGITLFSNIFNILEDAGAPNKSDD